MHRSDLLAELWEGDIAVGICVHDREHHAQVQVLLHNVLLDLLLG